MEAFILALLVTAAQAAPSLNGNAVNIKPIIKYMPVLEGAPVYPAISTRIVNGVPASRDLLPYQAALFLDGRNFCGGSLIADLWILTAAHCTVNVGLVTAHLGAVNLNADEDGQVAITTRGIINHANYNPRNLNNDVALVRLPGPVALSRHISLVSLPSFSQAFESFANHQARASGWGRISDTANTISPQLNFVDLNVISNSICARTYGPDIVVPGTLCAAAPGGRSTCNGDSGGPLVTLGNNPTLIGVISFVSSAGCTSGNPSGYMRVTAFLEWIHDISGIHIRN